MIRSESPSENLENFHLRLHRQLLQELTSEAIDGETNCIEIEVPESIPMQDIAKNRLMRN